jgi:hypothetical protein
MDNIKKLNIYDWYGKKFTSRAELFEAGVNNVLKMDKDIKEFGTYYSFYNLGKLVAKFYQDHTFGFCTQPYGIELNNTYGIESNNI